MDVVIGIIFVGIVGLVFIKVAYPDTYYKLKAKLPW
jgi:hypothetical protein|tara:strand:- start:21 stop:128 length:108 start_codon:yes stop_codon:yes gene_type:complete